MSNEEKEEILSIPPEASNNEENNSENILCDFIIKEKIGEGTFGKVKLAINRQTEQTVAIKILIKSKISKERDKQRLDKEIEILKSLRHPNIVHLFSDVHTKHYLYLIMEYIQGIELLKYISSSSKLPEEEACFYFRQIISSIEYLHKLKIAHRDIKPENMIIENSTKTLKLVDFGLSSYYNTKNEQLSSACGSPSYAAPEMLAGKKYGASMVDIWSSGIVLYAMICGYLPFEDFDNDILFKKIIEGKYKVPPHVSDSAKDLIKNILITNPKKRYTIEQIKNHKWFSLCLNNEEYREKQSLYEGLLLDKYVVPIDEEIIRQMNNEYKIKKDKIRTCLLNNDHNDITTIYYLILLKKTKSEKESVSDLKGNLFKKYLDNNMNLLSYYDNDINKVIEERKNLEWDDNDNNIQEKEDNQKNIVNNEDNEKNDDNIQKENINNLNDNKNDSEPKEETYLNDNNINNKNEIQNNDKSSNFIQNNNDIKNIKIIKSDNNKEKNSMKNIKKANKNSVFAENKNKMKKIVTPEKLIKPIKLKNNIQIKQKRNNSASKRTNIPKINNKKLFEIKQSLQNNKPKEATKDKSTKKKSIKTPNLNQPKLSNNKIVQKVDNSKYKPKQTKNIEITTEIKDSDEIEKRPITKYIESEVNEQILANNEPSNNKDKIHKTYKPKSLKIEQVKTRDRRNKTIIVDKSRISSLRKRINISSDKRKLINNNKNIKNDIGKKKGNFLKPISLKSKNLNISQDNNKSTIRKSYKIDKSSLLSGTNYSNKKKNF